MKLNKWVQLPATVKAKHNESQTSERCWCKEKGLFKCQPGRMVGSHLKDYLIFLLKLVILIGIERGEGFCPLSSHLSSFWYAQCKNLHLCHLGQWGRLPRGPWSVWYQGQWGGGAAGPTVRKPGDAGMLSLPPDAGHSAQILRGDGWSSWGMFGSWFACVLCAAPRT